VYHEGFAEGDDTLLGSRDAALEEEEIVLDDAVMGETTQGGNSLLADVVFGRGVVVLVAEANAVDLLVDLRSVMITILTGASDGEHDLRRMPSTDTGNLSETLVGFPWELLGSPTVGNTLESVTLGDSNDVDVLVLFEDGGDVNGLLEQLVSIGDLVRNGSTVQLDLHEVGLLLAQTSLTDLSVGENADNSTVFADALQFTISRLAIVLGVLLGIASESLLLRSVPVLVEPSFELFTEVGCPDGGESSEATWSLNVSNDTNNENGGCLHDGDGLNDLTFMHFGPWPVKITDNVGHTGLVAHESGQVNWLLGVIPWKGLDLPPVAGSTLPWEETQ